MVSVAPDGTNYTEAGTGQPIVFIHGVGMNLQVWEPQLTAFSRGFRTIAYDLLGHGESPLPPDPTTLRDLSSQLAGLLDHLGLERAHVIGHSLGALVALDFALRHPRRVMRLVALNGVYRRSPDQRRAAIERAGKLERGGAGHTLDATLERWFERADSTSAQDAMDRVRGWLQSANPCGYARIYRLFATADDAFVDRLRGLESPALFATGEMDPHSTPAMSRQMAEEAPLGTALVIAGKRHMMALVAADIVNAHIGNFLAGENDALRGFDGRA